MNTKLQWMREKKILESQTRLGLQCQTQASYLYLTKSFGYFQYKEPQSTLRLFEKKFVSEKILDRKIFEIRNKFWVCKNFGPKKILYRKIFWSTNWSLKSFWSKKVQPQACSFDIRKYSGWGQLSPGQMLHCAVPMAL